MSMRVYFDKDKVQKSSLFDRRVCNRQATPGGVDEPTPDQWPLLYLNGLQLHWDNQVGMPYFEVDNFELSLPKAVQLAAHGDHGFDHVRATTSWTGVSSSVILREKDNLEACMTRDGERVRLQIVSKFAPVSVQERYLAIRRGNQDGFKREVLM